MRVERLSEQLTTDGAEPVTRLCGAQGGKNAHSHRNPGCTFCNCNLEYICAAPTTASSGRASTAPPESDVVVGCVDVDGIAGRRCGTFAANMQLARNMTLAAEVTP
jgi:hypothetical protein